MDEEIKLDEGFEELVAAGDQQAAEPVEAAEAAEKTGDHGLHG